MVSARMAKNSTWNETSRWMRWLATGAGILGGVTCVMSGIFMSVTHLIDPKVFQTYCKVNSTFVGPYRLPTDAATWLLVFRFWSDILVQKRQFCPACHSKNGYNQILAQRGYLLWVSISEFLVSSDWTLFHFSLSMLSFILLASSSPMSAIGALIMPFATGTLYGLMSLGRKVGVLLLYTLYVAFHIFRSVLIIPIKGW